MKRLPLLMLSAAPLAAVSWYALFGPALGRAQDGALGFALVANAPAIAVAGVLSGNIHAPNSIVFALSSYVQWLAALWVIRYLVLRAKPKKKGEWVRLPKL